MSNEVKPRTTSPDNTTEFDTKSQAELSEGELQGVAAGIIAVLAPQASEPTADLTLRKAGKDQQEY
jgi:hypothetical protein